jgi:rhodanese-related sulfurtransferase
MVMIIAMQNRKLIDVRQPAEFSAGHIEGSELIPLRRLSRACENWDRKQSITLVCLSGHRAQLAHNQLRARGFKDVSVLPGGIRQWRAAGKPLATLPRKAGARLYQWTFRLAIVLASAVLAHLVSPWFLLIPALLAVRWIAIR